MSQNTKPTKEELKQIALSRLEEAKVLHQNQLDDGAMYLLGYVLETALKARICTILDWDCYPENKLNVETSFKTHNLEQLILLSGLRKELEQRRNEELIFGVNYNTIFNNKENIWSETFRYRAIGTAKQEQVKEYIEALEHEEFGVLTWIKKYW